jgi:hypothetical protein
VQREYERFMPIDSVKISRTNTSTSDLSQA